MCWKIMCRYTLLILHIMLKNIFRKECYNFQLQHTKSTP